MSEQSFSQIDSLIRSINNEIDDSEIKTVLEQKKTLRYWKIGQYLKQYADLHKNCDDYEKKLINEIVPQLSVGKRTLYFSLQFYADYPDTRQIPAGLSWTHLKILQSVSSQVKRNELQKTVIENNLSSRELQAVINKESGESPTSPVGQLALYPAVLNLYQTKIIKNKTVLDLGFSIYRNDFQNEISGFDSKTLLSSEKKDNLYYFSPGEINPDSLYTYKAEIVKIIDGDTITVDIDLGFDTIIRQKLRLRGIDCPEMDTPEGLKAKLFLREIFAKVDFIIIKTYKRDKYSRFLADIFYLPGTNDPEEVIESGFFLNQILLDKGLAIKY